MHENLWNDDICLFLFLHIDQRSRIKTEEKAKVIAAVWGKELIQFLAALAIFHQDDFEEKDE